jgi:hypothetical protein
MACLATEPVATTHLLGTSQITSLMVAEYRLWFVNGTDFYLQNSYLLPADADAIAWVRVGAPLTSTAMVLPIPLP